MPLLYCTSVEKIGKQPPTKRLYDNNFITVALKGFINPKIRVVHEKK
jgi:hypothetical protein